MRVASAERNARSCVTNSSAPANSRRCSSSQRIASMSRWLVGSSSSSRSGSETSALPSSVRRRQPPDSSPQRRSAGSDSRDTTISTFCSSRQPSRSSSWCCSAPRRSSADGVSGLGDSHRRLVVLGDERAELAETGRDLVEHGAIAGAGHVLVEPRRPGGRARARSCPRPAAFAGDDPQQARLAGAVAADERDALAGLDAQVRVARRAADGRRRAKRRRG